MIDIVCVSVGVILTVVVGIFGGIVGYHIGASTLRRSSSSATVTGPSRLSPAFRVTSHSSVHTSVETGMRRDIGEVSSIDVIRRRGLRFVCAVRRHAVSVPISGNASIRLS